MKNITRRYFLASVGGVAVTASIPLQSAPYSALELIARQKANPSIVQLARALERLQSTLSLMTTGAHPDDEPSGMLAALRYSYGISPIVYCITRGEGGQNHIGPERGLALGVLRTREMQEASRALDARLAFGASSMDDSVHDFGFSKHPEETLDRWGEDKVVERMVRAIRTYKPDIIFNCFNNVPGQHGHHRAAVLATDKAIALCGREDAFPEHFEQGLSPWQVAKVYDPAWSGSGSTYDDENPPPETTLVIKAPPYDEVSGASWPQMGEWSRACHLTQRMGRWIPEPQTEWPLHLRHSNGNNNGLMEADIREYLPANLAMIADLPGMSAECAGYLRQAQAGIDDIAGRYNQPDYVMEKAVSIGKNLDQAREILPDELRIPVLHRLERKRKEIDQVLAIAAGVHIRSFIDGDDLARSDHTDVITLVDVPDNIKINSVRVIARPDLEVSDKKPHSSEIRVPENAALTNPMEPDFDPLGGNGDAFTEVALDFAGYQAILHIDLEKPLQVVPQSSVTIEPGALVLNRKEVIEPVTVSATLYHADESDFEMILPPDWQSKKIASTATQQVDLQLIPPDTLKVERLALEPLLNGQPAYKVETFAYPHTGRAVVPSLATVPVQIVDARIPASKVAYIGSNNDYVPLWLRRMGMDVAELAPADVAAGEYRQYDTLIIGVFTFGKRDDLIARLSDIHEWVHQGGHLLTLYHRPSDGWDPERIPLAYLKIGSPSIRYRVTDANARVSHLVADHPLLNYPNKIGDQDWANWDKERGLYFAAEWDPVYIPLLSMHDPEESPLEGSLLSAEIGEGRHTHTSLILHHQLEKLTPGAYRIMANLVQPAKV